jgi:hypothetical protein
MTRGHRAGLGLAGLIVICVGAITIAQSPSRGVTGSSGVTFHKDVLPILQKNCQNCHRPGQIAPMSLLTYSNARPWARAIKTRVAAREMPPWHADPQYGIEYATDRSLKPAEIDTLVKWVDEGAVEGNPKDAPPPVAWPADGWVIKPDMVVRGPSFEVPAHPTSDVIEWTTIIVPSGFMKDTWVTSVEIKPSDLQVTHHMCIGFVPHRDDVQYYTPVWADKPRDEEGVEKRENQQFPPAGRGRAGNPAGRAVGGGPQQLSSAAGGGFLCYIPGNQVFDYRPFKAGALIPAGYDITFAQHYTPSGKKTVDFPQVGFTISDTPPQKRWVSGSAGMAGRDFAIPPNDPNYASPPGELEFGTDAELVMLMPHMHLRGKDMTYTVISPDGRQQIVLSVPKYDFNWQQQYVLKNPILVTAGTKLHVQAHYNNSASNKFNPNPNRWVYQGNMTWEEMMTPFMAVLVDVKVDPAKIFRRGFVATDGA